VLGQHPADAVADRADVGQKGDQGRFLRGQCHSILWVQGPSDRFVDRCSRCA
jgi:hypothetical protein